MTPRLLVAGSLNMDFVVQVERLPAPGETVLGRDFTMVPGGKGANQACAAGKLGAGRVAVQMAGRVGYDVFADHLKASLAANGVDVSLVHATRSQPTGTAFIWVDRQGQNSIVVASGANFAFAAAETEPLRARLRGCRWALFQLETPLNTVEALLRIAREEGVATMLDPAPAQSLDSELLRQVEILTPNESEACLLLGRSCGRITPADAPELADALLGLGPRSVVLKLGEQGSFYRGPEGSYHAPGFAVEALDTTAAGDTFNAAFAIALAEDRPIPEALRFANAAAALSVMRAGAQSSVPSRSEVDALLVEYTA